MIPDTLYDLAFRFKKTKLWKKLYDSQLFAVRHADGGIGYCCVMGMLGEHLALAVYPGDEGLDSYRLMGQDRSQMNGFEVQETALSQNCVMLSFENKSELRPKELREVGAYCASHGLAPRGRKAYPQLQRFRPHRFPWYVDDPADQARLAEALEAAMEVSETLLTRPPEALGFTEGAPFDRKIPLLEKKAGAFQWSEMALPEPRPICYPSPDIQNEIALMKLSKSKKRGGEWACDILMHVEPVSVEQDVDGDSEPKSAPFFPYLLLIVQAESGMVLGVQMSDGPEGYAEQFADAVLDVAVKSGRPTRILVCNERTHAFFAKLSARLDAQLTMEEQIPVLAEVREDFLARFTDQEDGQEAMMERMLEALRDPKALETMPDEMLTQLTRAADTGALPDDIGQALRRERERRERGKPGAPGKGTAPGRRGKVASMPAKGYVISVSLQPGCYRHIRIPSTATLWDLHRTILGAFLFDDDHAHAFFMDNKAWSDEDSYYVDFIEDADRFTNDFTLGAIGLRAGKSFKYVFDFGEDWCFQCKVLKELQDAAGEAEVIRSVGDPPEQYGVWDEGEEDEDEDDDTQPEE